MKTKKFRFLLLLIFLLINIICSYNEVSTSLHELDASVNDVVWCGNNKEYILLLTELNSVYRSEDHGFSWKKLNDILLHTGKEELEEHESEV